MGMTYTVTAPAPFTAEWRTSRYGGLAAALPATWRKHKHDWAAGGDTTGRRVLPDGEGLSQALARTDELSGEPIIARATQSRKFLLTRFRP